MEELHKKLYDAAKTGDLATIQILVEQGIDIHTNDNEALRTSAWNNYLEVVQYLVEHGADINGYPLHNSAFNGNLAIVQYLVERGADIHFNDDSALCWSANNGHWHVVHYLLEKGNYTLTYLKYSLKPYSSFFFSKRILFSFRIINLQKENQSLIKTNNYLQQKIKSLQEKLK